MHRARSHVLSLAFAAGLLAGIPSARGQDGPAEPDRLSQAAAELRDQAREDRARRQAEMEAMRGPAVSLDFPGGSLRDYVESLKAAADPELTNILVRGDADAIEVSATELRDVSLWTALRLVSGDYRYPEDDAYRYGVEATNLSEGAGDTPAFLVEVRKQGPFHEPRTPDSEDMLVLSIKELTTPLPGDPPEVVVPAETILTAVETATGVAGGDDVRAELRFHPESGLLIMAGPDRALRAANEVFHRMQQDIETRRARSREIQQIQGLTNPEALEEQLADARAEAELAAVHADNAAHKREVLERRMQEVRVMVDRAAAPQNEFLTAEIAYREADAAVREHQIHLERAQARAARAEEALARAKAIAAGGGSGGELSALREENAMLRDRLAAMEAQIAELRARLQARDVEEERR
ncbi:MAG TPA: hypothetical protein VFF69_09470 [Phycisphaerales bacterium]|nr:hypothetical protein [Phycisphaerales bacterium]